MVSKAGEGGGTGVPSIDMEDFLMHGKIENTMLYKKDRI